jgi:hypothetical protein
MDNQSNRYIRNEEEFQKFATEIRNRQYEENPIMVEFEIGFIFRERFSQTSTHDWDNEYLEIERIDNVDMVKIRNYNE